MAKEPKDTGGGINEAAPDEGGRKDRGAEAPFGAGAGSLAGLDGGGIAVEAAALGSADGALADAASDREPGAERLSGGPTGAEAIGQGAGRGDAGSGTPSDRGETGGGGPSGQQGGTGPEGTAKSGGEGRA